jgi:hypothetical protein
VAPPDIGIGQFSDETLEGGGMSVNDLAALNPTPLFAGGAKLPTMVSITPGGYYARGGAHVLDSYTAPWANPPVASLAAGRVEEYGFISGTSGHPDVEYPLGAAFSDRWLIDLWFNQDGIRQGSFGANCMCGFGVGSLLATPPNAVTSAVSPPFAAAPTSPSVQVQLRHIAGQDDVYLYTANGDGTTASTSTRVNLGQTSGVTGLSAQYNAAHRVQLEWNPATSKVTLRITDAIDAVIRTVQQTFAPASGEKTGFYIFAYTGTGSATGQQVSLGPGMLYTLKSGWGF